MQTGKPKKTEPDYFEIDDPSVQDSVNEGVMDDKLSIWLITKWTLVISIVVVILCAIAFNLYKYNKFQKEFSQAVNTEYRELQNMRQTSLTNLSSKEQREDGTFRIPVEDAFSVVIENYNE